MYALAYKKYTNFMIYVIFIIGDQIMDCLFCKINKGDMPSKTIYEDDKVKVIMDIYPEANGHTLLITKKHFDDIDKIDEEYLNQIFNTAKLIKKYIFNALNPSGIKYIINYGSTQLIKHFHLHLIPVYNQVQTKSDVNQIYEIILNSIKK